jgi:hypothetical protein
MDGDGGAAAGVPVVAAWFGSCAGDGTRVTGLAVLRPRTRTGILGAAAAAEADDGDGAGVRGAGAAGGAGTVDATAGAAAAATSAAGRYSTSGARDPRTRELRLYQFIDTDRWANLEAALVQNAPSHVYLADGCVPEAELKKVEGVLDGADITSERSGRTAFADAEAAAHLAKLTGDHLLTLDHVRALSPALQW